MSLLVISYDIINDNRRNRVSKVLLDYGNRVQYSVFEVSATEKLSEIKERVNDLIDKKEDNIRFYLLCNGCKKKVKVIGKERASVENNSGHIIV